MEIKNIHKHAGWFASYMYAEDGGKRYYFGGGSCSSDGGSALDSTYCFTANESGIYYHPYHGEQDNPYHSSIRKFKYVPYPHEI